MRKLLRGRRGVFAALGALGIVGTGVIVNIVIREPEGLLQRGHKEPADAELGPVESDVYGVLMEGVYELLMGGGASSAEARCLSKPFAQEANDIMEAVEDIDRTASGIYTRAPACVSRKRIQAILKGIERDDTRRLLEVSESDRLEAGERYLSSGATDEEVACIVAIQSGSPGSLGAARWLDVIALHEEKEYHERLVATLDAQNEELLRCGSEDRLRQLLAVPPDTSDMERELEHLQELGEQLDTLD